MRGSARGSAPQLEAEWQDIAKCIRDRAKERNKFAHWTTHFGVNFDPPIGPWLAPPDPHPKHGDPSSRRDVSHFKAAISDFEHLAKRIGVFAAKLKS